MPSRSVSERKPNPIGSLFRQRREQRGWSQVRLAQELSKHAKAEVSNKVLSEIELGGYPPTDAELLAFAELFSVDLQELIDLREASPTLRVRGERRPWGTGPTSAAPPPPPVPPAPAPPQPTPTVVSQPSSSSHAPGAFEAFVEGLCQAAPIPVDRERRQEWFRLAVKLYGLSG